MKKFLFSVFILFALSKLSFGQAQNVLFVTKATKSLKGDCWHHTEHLGYKIKKASLAHPEFMDMRTALIDETSKHYGVTSNNVTMLNNWHSPKNNHLCVIKYIREKGTKCEHIKYVFGFGTNQSTSQNAAIKEMKLFYSGTDFEVLEFVEF